jgi:hypothetical protein
MESHDAGDRKVSVWVNNEALGENDSDDDVRRGLGGDNSDDEDGARRGGRLNNKQRRETYRDY